MMKKFSVKSLCDFHQSIAFKQQGTRRAFFNGKSLESSNMTKAFWKLKKAFMHSYE